MILKRILPLMAVITAMAGASRAYAAKPVEAADTLTASEAFVRMPVDVLDLLTTSMRMDMLDWYKTDSIKSVPNAMEGESYLHRPVTRDYIRVQVTPVSTMALRLLPSPKGSVVAAVYTIGDTLSASDSQLSFFSDNMEPLKAGKYIKLPETKDFFDFADVDRKTRDEVLELVPFPTIRYDLSPETDTLTATLTVGEYMGKEDFEKISPYLRRERVYRWTGTRYEMEKN